MARLFTLEEANALIPELEARFRRIHELQRRAGPLREEVARLELKGKSNGKDLAVELREAQERLAAIRREAEPILQEITDLGCEVKDVESGLVDFPAERGGRVVYLCWKLGEDRIRYWHELSTGFAGRQPL
jgi:hypothetical protein